MGLNHNPFQKICTNSSCLRRLDTLWVRISWDNRTALPPGDFPVTQCFYSQHSGTEPLVICFSASGNLKGFDQLLNLVLDGTTEYLRGKCCQSCLMYVYGATPFERPPWQEVNPREEAT